MRIPTSKTILSTAVALTLASQVQAGVFNRIASFNTSLNIPTGIENTHESSAEIITVSESGDTLIYTDGPLKGLGFIDIRDENKPTAAGFINLDGEPTSVATSKELALVGVNTSRSYTAPSGYLAAFDINSRKKTAQCDLGGQPDSVAVAPSGKFVATAIENERDEDLNNGVIPQGAPGYLSIIPLKNGQPVCDQQKKVALTGLASLAPEDPEPEFVDINSHGEIVISIQENNHFAIVDGNTGKLIHHFDAGSVDLDKIDVDEERALTFSGSQQNRKREPDAVKWLDDNRFVSANEGDYEGGSRGFTIFSKKGEVLWESGTDFEHRVAMAGHYPEKRSGNKGVEPEGLAIGRYNGETYIFVMAERSSVVGVYRDTGAAPEFVQLLPSGISPESAAVISERGLLATANEKDLIEDGGVRAHVMLYKLGTEPAQYPQIVSQKVNGKPIGWGALSGLAAHPSKAGSLYAVNDSFYRMQPNIFEIDAIKTPAVINRAIPVTRAGQPAQKLDLEGITSDGNGGFWLASEGRPERLIPHAIYHTNENGEIDQEIAFPAELQAVQKRWASEGITLIGDTLWIAIQRQWKDDPENTVKLVAYNTKSKEWGAVRYPTEKAQRGWVGLSEITVKGDYAYIIERDNQIGEHAAVKQLSKVKLSELKPAPLGEKLPLVKKELVRDFIPDLRALNGYVVDKIEGFAIDANGNGFAITDNDGVDDSSGETYFFSVGKL